MARTPTVYRWDDPGAPDLSALHSSNNERDLMYFHTVLKACLVTGYGAKAAAGWTMPLEETTATGNRFVLTNAANSGSLLYEGGSFSGGGAHNADTLWACSAVPDMDNPINAWSWNIKYVDRSSANGSVFHKPGLYEKFSEVGWLVIANENICIVVCGRDGDFSVGNSGGLSQYHSCVFAFGVMHSAVSDVLSPGVGNFYIAGGIEGSFSGVGQNYGLSNKLLTSIQDIVGLEKEASHTYSFVGLSVAKSGAKLNAWLPEPVIYTQYGPSSPNGNSASRVHFAVSVPSLRRLKLQPIDFSALNSFMVDNSFEYGKSVSYNGYSCVICKSADGVVNVFSLDPAEWGA